MLRFAVLSLFSTVLCAAEFQTGQAARAVLGQSSFSSQELGIRASSLTYADNQLYAAETLDSQHFRVQRFDLGRLPGARVDLASLNSAGCAVCGLMPASHEDLQAAPASPAIAGYGNIQIVADAENRQVRIWRNWNQAPDVILRGFGEPVSVAYDGHRLFVGDAARHRVFLWNSLPKTSDRPADVVLGSSGDTLGPDTIRVPEALASDGENLYVADPASRRILVFSVGDTQLPPNAMMNAASLASDLFAPGTLAYISGPNLSEVTKSAPESNTEPLSRKLGGVQVFLNGTALPILSVSSSEVHTQLPYDLNDASAASIYVRTEHADGHVTTTNALALKLGPATPGLFAFGGKDPRSGLLLHANGTPVTDSNPARPGEQLTAWAAGLGAVHSSVPIEEGTPYTGQPDDQLVNPVFASINGQPAQVQSAGLPPGAIGVYEIRIVLPDELPPDSNTRLTVAQNGYVSNTVTFPVGNIVR